MDWIRRNWPDLLIGVALVAVIALIVATLLSGGSMVSLLQRGSAPELPITTTTGPAGGQPRGDTQATGLGATGTGSGTTGSGATNPAEGGNVDVFVPGVAGSDEGASAANPAEGPATTATTPDEAGTTPAGTAQPGAASSVNTPLPESVPNGGFRVAAGAVNSRDGAISSAETLREADYTVTIEQQGELYLLWIGPYASRAGAERVVERLSADELVPDALVYTYDPDEAAAEAEDAEPGTNTPTSADTTPETGDGANADATASAAPAQNSSPPVVTTPAEGGAGATAQQPADETPTDTAATGELTAPAGQRFLQVGAFGSDESAQPQRQQLESLGLTVTSRQDDNGVIRLYVGPFAGEQLAQTQNRLDTQGIDSFPVTP